MRMMGSIGGRYPFPALAWMWLALLLAIARPCVAAPPAADVLLRGGTIYDGSGGPPVVGDVVIAGGKIVAVGRCDAPHSARIIDCANLVVAPGFIDLHTHCDPTGKPEVRRNLNYLTQGCTTVMTGNCGGGEIDVAAYCRKIDRDGAGTNVLLLVPHGSVRARAMGGANREPTPDELQRMKDLVERGMRDGAWGMSTGLIYTPGMFAKTDEIVALARVVGAYHGLYVTHLRNEAQNLLPALHEALAIGREAQLPVHISHLKAVGPRAWGSVRAAASLIEAARAEGQRVTADQYPYVATSTGLTPVLFPATEIPGGLKDFARRIKTEPDYERAVRKLVERRMADNPRIVIASCKAHPAWVGKSLHEIAAELHTDLTGAAIHIQADGGAAIVRFVLSEEDVRWGMQIPWVATASDGSTQVPDPATRPHPRSFGTFPRKIGRYAQRENVLSLAQAIRSATGLPADILPLTDRGYLRPGLVADVVVFDPATFIDRATFDDPQQYSTGVRWVLLAGQPAIADGQPTDGFFGRTLRHPAPVGLSPKH
jgi:N-acyl-D-amino-acid deacylase